MLNPLILANPYPILSYQQPEQQVLYSDIKDNFCLVESSLKQARSVLNCQFFKQAIEKREEKERPSLSSTTRLADDASTFAQTI